MKLHLIRHTSLAIAAGVCYGQTDVDVSERFHEEGHLLKQKLSQVKFDAVYSSPSQRCVKLATALNVGAAQLDPRLMELHFGDWEMQRWEAIARIDLDAWAKDYASAAPPNGESFSQLHARVLSFLEDVSNHSHGKNIAVITHGGIIRALLAEALHMPLKEAFRLVIDHASVSLISFEHEIPSIHFVNR